MGVAPLKLISFSLQIRTIAPREAESRVLAEKVERRNQIREEILEAREKARLEREEEQRIKVSV